jgi:hypothetical protein
LFHRRQGKWIFLQQLVHQRQIIDTLEGKKKSKKRERERTHGQPLVHAQLQIEHVGPGGAKKRKIKRSIVPPSIN